MNENQHIPEGPTSHHAPSAQKAAAPEINSPKNYTRGKVAATLAGAVVGLSSLFQVSDAQAAMRKPSDAQVLLGTRDGKKAENAAVAAQHFPKFITLQSLKDATRSGKMEPVENGPYYTLVGVGIEDPENRHAYAALRPHAKRLLDTIAQKFHQKFKKKLVVSSLARTEAYVDILRKKRKNKNASKTSTHMYGTTFDFAKNGMSQAQLIWMRKTLADMERSGQIAATEEWVEPCFHIVDIRANRE